MFWQWCVADGEEGAAAFGVPGLAGAVPVSADDVVDDDDTVAEVEAGDECDVAALATARLLPSPTPSAPIPTAVAMMIRPSLVFNVSASKEGWVMILSTRTPALAAACLRRQSPCRMKSLRSVPTHQQSAP
jgi:hypothetical protein